MKLIRSIFILIILFLISFKTSKLAGLRIEQRLQNKIDSLYYKTPESIGILVHVEYPKANISWSGAIGVSNKETKTKVSPNQTILIASNTKTFVAATILRLYEEHKLNLDSSIGAYLSEKTKKMMLDEGYDLDHIKIKNLLSHTSGINDYVQSPEFKNKLQNQPKYQWKRDEQIEIAIQKMDRIGVPEYLYKYSDTNYLLLSEIIEQVTGMEFHKAISQLIEFDNNRIKSTWFEGLESAPSGALPLAHQYIEKWNLDTYNINKSFDLYGGGGLASTTKDLSLFIHKIFNDEIFKNTETKSLLLTKVETKISSNNDYRFGIWKTTLNGKTSYGHGGFWGTMVLHIPDLNATISIAILNKDKAFLRKEIAEAIIKELLK